jgi:hypothetical protein
MRYAAMQCLTWGTVLAAVASALLLAAMEMPTQRFDFNLPSVAATPAPASAAAGRQQAQR